MRILSVILLLSGCATHKAIVRGDDAAARGDWDDALVQYRRADLRKPDDPRIDLKIEAASDALIAEQQGVIAGLIGAGDLAGAAYAISETHRMIPEADLGSLERKLSDTTVASIDAKARRSPIDALQDGTEALQVWLPGDAAISEARDRARVAVLQDAARDRDAGRYESAVWAYRRVDELYPGAGDAALESRATEIAWADALLAEAAKDEKAGRSAHAYVRAARAADLSGRPADATRRDLYRSAVLADALDVRVDVTGDGAGSDAVMRAIRPVTDRPGVALGKAATPEILVAVDVDACRFDDRSTVYAMEARYLAGTRSAINPQFQDARRRDRAAQDAILDAERAADARRDGLRSARAELDQRRQAAAPWDAAARQADADLEANQQRVIQALHAWRENEALLETARQAGPPAPDLVDRTKDSRERLEKALIAFEEALEADRLANERARPYRDAVRTAESAASQREADLAHAERIALQARQDAQAPARDLDATPAVVEIEDWQTLRYEDVEVTRTCVVVAELAVDGRSVPIRGSASTVDRWHRPVVRAGVSEDPLVQPIRDGELQSRADAEVARQIADYVDGAISTWASGRIGAADRAGSDEEALRNLLVARFVTGRASPELAKWLDERFGMDPALLR